jgi:hypothetical protein
MTTDRHRRPRRTSKQPQLPDIPSPQALLEALEISRAQCATSILLTLRDELQRSFMGAPLRVLFDGDGHEWLMSNAIVASRLEEAGWRVAFEQSPGGMNEGYALILSPL